ncbi:MAG: hypothetical protein JXA43_02760 [Candidatus Diapherotrites archaeon]|nr:hypothetical protein [Candidatus Diapherotrites archaeon]
MVAEDNEKLTEKDKEKLIEEHGEIIKELRAGNCIILNFKDGYKEMIASDDEENEELYECPMCGGKLNENEHICPHCGEELE